MNSVYAITSDQEDAMASKEQKSNKEKKKPKADKNKQKGNLAPHMQRQQTGAR